MHAKPAKIGLAFQASKKEGKSANEIAWAIRMHPDAPIDQLKQWPHLRWQRGSSLADCISEARDRQNHSALHIAALAGHRNLCKVLLRLGLSATEKNQHGRTPVDMARLSAEDDFVCFLEEAAMETHEQRYWGGVGTGEDLLQALQDTRYVTSLTWFTKPLDTALGLVLKHSFLVVKVEDEDAGTSEEYVLEKCDGAEHFKNGVMISLWWYGLAVPGQRTLFRCLGSDEMSSQPVTLLDLWQKAVETGPYSLVSNCHTAVHAAFNHCAVHHLELSGASNVSLN
eukprot:6483614-Amphidinium_carterae.1